MSILSKLSEKTSWTHDLSILRLKNTKKGRPVRPKKSNLCSRRQKKTLFKGFITRVKHGKRDGLRTRHVISLACVSSDTHNLQCFFFPRGGGEVVPYIGYVGMCRAKGYVFLAVLV